LLAPLAVAAGAAHAQATTPRVTVQPTLTVEQTLTDNVELSDTDRRSEAITRVSPGIDITSRAGRVVGSLQYSADALIHARETGKNTVRNSLSAIGSAEVVENHLDVDARASITQQSISAFGTQAGGTGLVSDNTTEVAIFSISPSLRFNLGPEASGSASVEWTRSRASSTDAGDSDSHSADIGAGGRHGIFGWNLSASRVVDDFTAGRDTTQDEAVATLSLAPWKEVSFFVRAGWEANDVLSEQRVSDSFRGAGITVQPHDTLRATFYRDRRYFGHADALSVDWFPTERTNVSLSTEDRFYGRSHGVRVSHRFARALVSYTDTRGLSGGDRLDPRVRLQFETYQQTLAQCSALPRPEDQATCIVRALQQAYGEFGNGIAGVLGTSLSNQRAQNLSFFHPWIRTTLSLTVSRTESNSLTGITSVLGDLNLTDRVVRYGWSAGLTHRLTRETSLALGASRQVTADARRTTGSGGGVLAGNEQRQFTASLSTTLGPRTTGSVSLRHVVSDGGASPYHESALIARLDLRF
jgi:uncharacterized protein (PEP-CTERM system associated)